ncbi:MAG: bile acid:sodium symporter [Treponema sp.]|jgi:ACR3 family arsenite efflux pump ArsB|nr:bile acid:sodium symporter [Treponema sp.]
MSIVTKLQPLFIIVSALTGIALGKLIPLSERYAGNFIGIFLTCMLFFVFLNVKITEILKSFSDPRFSVSALIINFVFTPVFSLALSKLFLSAQIDLQIGFIMLMVTPCTDWYLVFTGVAGGNVSLGASILPLNLILQIVLLPVYLLLFMGTEVSFGFDTIMNSIALVLITPLVAANAVKLAAKRIGLGSALETITKKSDDIQFILLCLAIISMFASQGALLLGNSILFIKLLPASLLFFAVIFFLSLCAGKALKLPFENIIPLVFTTSARNSPISLAIATITFPLRPVISLVLVIGPLLELPILAIFAALLKLISPGYKRPHKK